jgi:LCP family protein required for cell wall assembly
MKKAVRIFLIVFLTMAVTLGMIVYSYLNSFSVKSRENGGSLIEAKETKAGEPFNILLLGVDIGTVGSPDSPKRTDTMIVLHYDPKTAEVSMLSIPRDTRVMINDRPEKINAANVRGGTSKAIEVVEELLGISINYYVEINYEGFRELIDAVGGIDIVCPYDMDYDAPSQDLHIHFKKGQKVHLDGQKAEEFVRWRKNNDGTGYTNGDLGRARTQQDFIIKVLEKLKSPSTILKIPAIAKILPDYIKTNMDAITILKLSKEITRVDVNSIKTSSLQGDAKTIDDLWYFIYDPDKNRDIIALFGGKTAPGSEEPVNKDMKILILNGSGMDGAAAKVKQKLEAEGYTVVSTGDISGVNFTSSYVIDKTLEGQNARQIASELDIKTIERNQDNLSKVDLMVILGTDKKGILY